MPAEKASMPKAIMSMAFWSMSFTNVTPSVPRLTVAIRSSSLISLTEMPLLLVQMKSRLAAQNTSAKRARFIAMLPSQQCTEPAGLQAHSAGEYVP